MFYDGTKLLSLKDKNGNDPEIYICCGNRSSGKTTYFSKLLVNRFLKFNKKFCLLYRYNYELDGVHNKFFNDLKNNFYKNLNMKSVKKNKGVYVELYLNDNLCGYAISINNAEQIKKCSSLISDVDCIFFDEFQSENNKYCPNEVEKFISVHTSLARGFGKQVKRLPVYMISNKTSLLNPYFSELGISAILKADCKFMRGEGFVLEQNINQSAADKQRDSQFNIAFNRNKYINYSAQNVYLNDNLGLIEKLSGRSKYLATIKYKNKKYAIREFTDEQLLYCCTNVDNSFPTVIAISATEHNSNSVMLKSNDFMISNYRLAFENGLFRFQTLECKECILQMLHY